VRKALCCNIGPQSLADSFRRNSAGAEPMFEVFMDSSLLEKGQIN
jgi:hypothetical protein